MPNARAAAVCVVLLASGAGACRNEQRGAVNVGDASIRYEATGSGSPIVLIHGWSQDLGIWDDQVAAFAPRYRVVRYDRRGYGRSTGHADQTADPDDLRVLLDSLRIPSATVLGLSAGGRTALDFAIAFPERVRSLVLYGAGPPEGFQPARGGDPNAMFAAMARQHGLDSLGRFLFASPLAWSPPNRPDIVEKMRASWARYEGRDLLDPRPASGRVALSRVDQLHQIRVPTLVITGDHEMPLLLAVADTLVQRIPGARRVVIIDAGHGAHFAQPERFNDAVLAHLSSVDSPKRP